MAKKTTDSGKLYTSTEVAEIRGCHKSVVNKHANKLKIGRKVSQTFVFTEAEKDQLIASIQDGPGNPEMGADQPLDKYPGKHGKRK